MVRAVEEQQALWAPSRAEEPNRFLWRDDEIVSGTDDEERCPEVRGDVSERERGCQPVEFRWGRAHREGDVVPYEVTQGIDIQAGIERARYGHDSGEVRNSMGHLHRIRAAEAHAEQGEVTTVHAG